MAKIIVSDGPGRQREVELANKLLIGRGSDVDVKLAGLDVSLRHAKISRGRDGYIIADLQSQHGTFVDGKRVARAVLHDGARIDIGGRQIIFMDSDESAVSPDPPTARVARLRETRPERSEDFVARLEGGRLGAGLNVVASRDSVDPLLFVGPSAFRHEGELERLRDRLRALRELGQQISGTHSSDVLLQQILELLAAALPQAQRGFIALINAASGEMEVKKSFPSSDAPAEGAGLNKAVAAHVVSTSRAILCDDVESSPSVHDVAREPRGSLMCARSGSKFSQDDLDFLVGSASMAASAMETARLCDELREARQLLVMEYRRLNSQQSELEAENVELRRELKRAFPFEAIIGTSPKVKEAIALVQKVKDSAVSVLITGESGTGKEMLAKAIHYNSLRSLKPFIALNCAAMPESLLESELFGIEKGVATGVESRIGKLELAHGGTLFLDEVADMALATQAKLLRVLQERELTRVGGHTPVKVDLRVIAATNKNLRAAIAEGKFREELFYRLDVIEVALPPLRERKEDILLLANHFLKVFAGESKKVVKGFTRHAEESLLAYEWPGNVREMKNAMQRCVVLADPGGTVDRPLLPPQIAGITPELPVGARRGRLEAMLASIERTMIREAMAAAGGNKSKAATALGISREGLRLKLAKYGLK
jgi:Nif-specific regulatory protein